MAENLVVSGIGLDSAKLLSAVDAAERRLASFEGKVDQTARRITEAQDKAARQAVESQQRAAKAAEESAKRAADVQTREAQRAAEAQTRYAEQVAERQRLIDSLASNRAVQAARARERVTQQSSSTEKARVVQNATEQAKAAADALERTFQRDMAKVREAQARGLLSEAQAREAGRMNAIAFNDGMLSAISTGRTAGAFRGVEGQAQYVAMAGSIKNVREESARATIGLGRLREATTSIAAAALHSAPGVAQFSSVLGSMALGSATMVAVMAGAAALGLIWRTLTADARENKEATKEAVDELERLVEKRREGLTGKLDRAMVEQEDQLQKLARKVATRQRQVDESTGAFSAGRAGAEARLRAAQKEYNEVALQLKLGEEERVRIIQDARRRLDQEYRSDLVALITANKATEQERARARRLLKEDRAALAALPSGEQSNEALRKRAELTARIEQLENALTGTAARLRAEREKELRATAEQQAALREAAAMGLATQAELDGLVERRRLLQDVQDDESISATARINAAKEVLQIEEVIAATRIRNAARPVSMNAPTATGSRWDTLRVTRDMRLPGNEGRLRQLAEEVRGYSAEAFAAERAQQEQLIRARDLASEMGATFADAYAGIITGSQGAGQAIKRMVDGMVADLLRLNAQKFFTQLVMSFIAPGASATTSSGGFTPLEVSGPMGFPIPGRASGGPVAGGRPYIVGERGPELFVPKSSGTIVPNGAQVSGGGQMIVHQTINFPIYAMDGASVAEVLRTQKGTIAQIVGEAVRESSGLRAVMRGA